ncbi:MAG: uridine kinase [Chthonomonadaceae bacterium]|nr:uridine kinase [Chthonomonadaceae bacterium]
MKQKGPPVLIGLAGGSGSGKTFLARQIQVEAGADSVALLGMDQYFRPRQNDDDDTRVNFDHPAYIDFRALIRDIKSLRIRKKVLAPSYDFLTQTSQPKSIEVEPRDIVIVEGLFVLAQPVHKLFDLTCFLDVAPDQRLLGRILRDNAERGAGLAEIVDRYQRYVRPAYDVFVAPTMHNADVVVDFTYRRAMFTAMLAHMASDYSKGVLDLQRLIESVKQESFHMGYRPEQGIMPITADIFQLAKAYPPTLLPTGVPTQQPSEPRLFIHNHTK